MYGMLRIILLSWLAAAAVPTVAASRLRKSGATDAGAHAEAHDAEVEAQRQRRESVPRTPLGKEEARFLAKVEAKNQDPVKIGGAVVSAAVAAADPMAVASAAASVASKALDTAGDAAQQAVDVVSSITEQNSFWPSSSEAAVVDDAPPVATALGTLARITKNSEVLPSSLAVELNAAAPNGTEVAAVNESHSAGSNDNIFAVAQAAMQDIAAAMNNTDPCPCGATTSPPPPYQQSPQTEPVMVNPAPTLDAAAQAEINATRAEAMKNCMVTEWTEWGACEPDTSGGGLQADRRMRERQITQPENGGQPCPPLEQVILCDDDDDN